MILWTFQEKYTQLRDTVWNWFCRACHSRSNSDAVPGLLRSPKSSSPSEPHTLSSKPIVAIHRPSGTCTICKIVKIPNHITHAQDGQVFQPINHHSAHYKALEQRKLLKKNCCHLKPSQLPTIPKEKANWEIWKEELHVITQHFLEGWAHTWPLPFETQIRVHHRDRVSVPNALNFFKWGSQMLHLRCAASVRKERVVVPWIGEAMAAAFGRGGRWLFVSFLFPCHNNSSAWQARELHWEQPVNPSNNLPAQSNTTNYNSSAWHQSPTFSFEFVPILRPYPSMLTHAIQIAPMYSKFV